MTNPRSPMICPRCGAVMNRHAEKPVEPRNSEEALGAASGGLLVEEAHLCPNCHSAASRRMVLG